MDIDRFKELLNLYLDDEISSAELSELISETRRDPERQELFLEYCRIHKACSLLRNELNAEPAGSRSVRQLIYAFGGLAAAVALLAMAGRNLVPLVSGGDELFAAQPSEVADERFPEFVATEVLAISRNPQTERLVLEPVGFMKGSQIDISNVRSAESRLRLKGQEEDFRKPIEELLRDGLGKVFGRPEFGGSIDEIIDFETVPMNGLSQDRRVRFHRLEFEVTPTTVSSIGVD